MTTLFWWLLFLIVYCYFGYPFLLTCWAKIKPRSVQKSPLFPSVSVLISVCDEEDVIERKIQNLLSLDYPAEKIEILIGSDGSKDRTVALVRQLNDQRIFLMESSVRQGKMATINQLSERARGEILVFTDARQVFDVGAIREMVANFADPLIGCVSGELMFYKKEGATAQGVSLYWSYEKFIRQKESQCHSMLGATGAIYAVRRQLFSPNPTNVVLDDVFTPLKIILKGYRAIFEPKAKAFDQVAETSQEEHRRKARTLYGNYQIFFLLPQVFNPFRSPISIQMFSHKLLRVLIPFFMILVFLINLVLLDGPVYRFIFILQIIFYFLAGVGALAGKRNYGIFNGLSKVTYIPYVFCLLNFSALTGFFRFIRAKQDVTWEKARGQDVR